LPANQWLPGFSPAGDLRLFPDLTLPPPCHPTALLSGIPDPGVHQMDEVRRVKPGSAPSRQNRLSPERIRECPCRFSILLAVTKAAKRYSAEAVIDLPTALLLGSEFLGLLKPAVIGGVEVHVVLPDFSRSGHETVLHPRAKVDWVGSFETKESEDDPGWPFGRLFGRGEAGEFSATRLLVLPKDRLTLRAARKVQVAAEEWVRLLTKWIDVVAREDLSQERVKVEKRGHVALVWVKRGKGAGEVLKGQQTLMLNFGSRLNITPREWGKILLKASSGARPPEAHLFLRDARQTKNAGYYRRSVLDSATATELGLAKLRDDELIAADASLERYVRGKAQQIGGLREFLSLMGRDLPQRIQQDVGEPRNKAIHEGYDPDEGVAEKALVKAEEVVGLAFPWKELLR
jgi:hypothetical protein